MLSKIILYLISYFTSPDAPDFGTFIDFNKDIVESRKQVHKIKQELIN
jgi:hypothetical protein